MGSASESASDDEPEGAEEIARSEPAQGVSETEGSAGAALEASPTTYLDEDLVDGVPDRRAARSWAPPSTWTGASCRPMRAMWPRCPRSSCSSRARGRCWARRPTWHRSRPGLPAIPKWLRKVIERGLSVRKEDRFASMDELIETLERGQRRRRRLGRMGLGLGIGGLLVTAATARSGPDPDDDDDDDDDDPPPFGIGGGYVPPG